MVTSCLPSPWWPSPWCDPELERLQRLQRERLIEEEKARLRDWLRRHGVPEQRIAPPFPRPVMPFPLPSPRVPCVPVRPSVDDVLRRVG